MNERKLNLWGPILAFCAVLIICTVGIIFKDVVLNKTTEQTIVDNLGEEIQPTIDDIMVAFVEEQNLRETLDLYYSLPYETVKSIYIKLGTTAVIYDVIHEYIKNTDIYINEQVANSIKNVEVEGPDKDRIESIKVVTTLKDPVKESATVPITAGSKDSLQ